MQRGWRAWTILLLCSEQSYQLQREKPQPKQKKNKHLFANITKKKCAVTLFPSTASQHRAKWGSLPLPSRLVLWFLLNELHSSKMSSFLQTLLSLAARFLLRSEAQRRQ